MAGSRAVAPDAEQERRSDSTALPFRANCGSSPLSVYSKAAQRTERSPVLAEENLVLLWQTHEC